MTQVNTVNSTIQDGARQYFINVIDSLEPGTHVFEYYLNRLITAPVSEEQKDGLGTLLHRWGAKRFIASLVLESVNNRWDKRSINAMIKGSLANTKGRPLAKAPRLKPVPCVPLPLHKAV